ncbi:LOW QUALITY PROTEIN: neogenin-like [Galleria mellonella]|uniref:LOW QUALITY PROTEIN: neogenin-like n=1 Tax=Galleria mellonella TaxID=7137 RepID=A0ABM3MS54_GALME|nr:LOW QUALITY PROTEIN: neogenin-like [Galleria mellonella]
MCRTGMCRFGIGNWIFLVASIHLFTYVQGGDDQLDPGVRFLSEPLDAVVAEGDSTTLACSAAAHHPTRLTWRHSITAPPTRDHTLSLTDKYRKQLTNGSLQIEKMSATLAGQYQCVVTVDGVGTIVSRVATIFLAELPVLTPGPRSVLGALGGTALLTCTMRPAQQARVALRVLLPATATPDRRVYGAARLHTAPPTLKLNVTWLKNGSPLRLEEGRVSITASGALEVETLRLDDQASYACRVALAHRLDKYVTGQPTELVVSAEAGSAESPPRFIATPQPLTVMEGASATFDCAAAGNPKPEITWLNNGIAIDLNDLDSRFYLVGSGSLRVQSARALDAGAYTCRAHSRLDSADCTTQLHVLTPPRVQLHSGPVVKAHTRGDVTLRCEARGRPPPSLAWLKDGEPLTPNNHDIAIVDGSLRIQGVLAVDAGMFQCAARSPAGAAAAALRLAVLPPRDDTRLSKSTKKLNTTHILKTLITVDFDTTDPTLDSNFLGETSSAYTPVPDMYFDEDVFHAAEDLDLDALRSNASIVSAPKSLKAVLVKHRFVTLSWEEPEHIAEELMGYAVMYRVKGSERERVWRGGAARHETNVPVQPATTYQFVLRAITARALSPPSQMIEVTTPEEELTYGPPTGFRVETLGPHAIRAIWEPPAPLEHVTGVVPPPTKYQVYCTEVETGREQVQVVEALAATLGGLRAAAEYSVRVAAAGGGPAGPRRARTASDAPAAPPSNVSAAPAGAASILVRWEAPPVRTHRGPLTGYKLRYRPVAPGGVGGTRRKADSLTTPADARRAELRDLETGTTYQIRVCAINANGSGPFSEWVTATTLQQLLDETRVPGKPPPLTTRAGRDWISVWWSEEGGGDGSGGVVVRSYWLGWGLGVPDEQSRQLAAHQHSHVIRSLEPNSEYVISLRAGNSLGLGPPVYATVRTRPAAAEGDEPDLGDGDGDDPDGDDEDEEDEPPPLIPPVGLKAIMLSGTTAVLYWTDPTLAKGQTATDGRRYVVRWAAAGGRPRYFNASDLNCMLDDLRPYTTYEFAVKLIKGGRESPWSMLASNTSLEATPGGPPRELRIIPAAPAARAVDLAWQPPAKPNGRITGYVVMYAIQRSGAAAGGEEWTPVAVGGDRVRARVDRLRPRTTYAFKVQARNARGLGPFSQSVAYTTPLEAGEGGGLASATSAWLWASAGGACAGAAVLLLAAALALSLCCRRAPAPLSPDTSTYQKSSASAAIKPPDLWIHHDQMELKHMDKSLHSSASKSTAYTLFFIQLRMANMLTAHLMESGNRPLSAGSTEGSALAASTLTLGRAGGGGGGGGGGAGGEYEPARHPPPASLASLASLDRRHYVPTYVELQNEVETVVKNDKQRGKFVNLKFYIYLSDRDRCDGYVCMYLHICICMFFLIAVIFCLIKIKKYISPTCPTFLITFLLYFFIFSLCLVFFPVCVAYFNLCLCYVVYILLWAGRVDSRRSPSCGGSDESAVRSSPSAPRCERCDRYEYRPMTGVGVGVGVGVGGAGCAATCDRRPHARHALVDQSTPLLAGVAPLGSPQSSLHPQHPLHQHSQHPHQHPQHPPPAPCGSGTCPLGAACSAPTPPTGGPGGAGGDIYACAARERGHYVAYEPLGHYTHRDSLSSEAAGGGGGGGGGGGSLQRGRGACSAMHSFALQDAASDHSTPSHSRGSVRETSPYKKSASSSPGHIPNRLQLGGGVPHCAEELEPLTPSRSTERLHREMQNLEGLMKDLSAITQQQFHC